MTTPAPFEDAAYRIVLQHEYHGRKVYNSLGWKQDAGDFTDAATAQQLASKVTTEWTNNVMNRLHADLVFKGAIVYSMQDPTIGVAVSTNAAGQESTGVAGQSLHVGLCARVKWVTGKRGRRFQGRTGLAGIAENHVVGESLTPEKQTNLAAGLSAFFVNMQTVGPSGAAVPGGLAVISETYGIATEAISSTVESGIGTRVARFR